MRNYCYTQLISDVYINAYQANEMQIVHIVKKYKNLEACFQKDESASVDTVSKLDYSKVSI